MAYSTAPLRIDELARSRGWEMAGDDTFVCEYEPNRVRMKGYVTLLTSLNLDLHWTYRRGCE